MSINQSTFKNHIFLVTIYIRGGNFYFWPRTSQIIARLLSASMCHSSITNAVSIWAIDSIRIQNLFCLSLPTLLKGKDKAFPLQARSGPEGSRKLRHRMVVRLSAFTSRKYSRYSFLLEAESTIVRSEGFYVIEKFQRHQPGSNQRPSDL